MRDDANDGEKIQVSLEQRQVALLAASALLILGVVFALGVMVGRQLASAALAAPAQPPAGDLRALDAEKPPPRPAQPMVASATNSPGSAENAPAPAANAGAAHSDRAATAPGAAHPAMPVHTSNPPPDDSQEDGRAEKPPTPDELQENDDDDEAPEKEVAVVAPEGTATVAAPEKPVTVAAPKDPNDGPLAPLPEHLGKFTVQFGSTQDRKDAERLAARAKAQGLKPYIVAAHLGAKGTWYRLRAGAFANREEAASFQKDVDRELHVKSAVMPAAEPPGK